MIFLDLFLLVNLVPAALSEYPSDTDPAPALVVTSLDDAGRVEGYQVDSQKEKKLMDILGQAEPIAGKIEPIPSSPSSTPPTTKSSSQSSPVIQPEPRSRMELEGGSNPLISGRMAQGGLGRGEEDEELGILANRFVQTFPNKTKIYGLQRDLVNRRELDQILAARNELEAWLAKAQVGPGQSWQRQSPNQQVERQAEPATTKGPLSELCDLESASITNCVSKLYEESVPILAKKGISKKETWAEMCRVYNAIKDSCLNLATPECHLENGVEAYRLAYLIDVRTHINADHNPDKNYCS